jgi:hypothetical protein
MSYQFNAAQLAELSNRLMAATSNKSYQPVYQYIYDQITYNGAPATGVDKSVWLWVKGALGVNSNDGGYFSDYIRDWTAAEYQLQNGRAIPASGAGSIQDASNDIAARFANDILNTFNDNPGHDLPSLSRTGVHDAGSVASKIFGNNYSPWAGTILFTYLGEGSYVRNGLLNVGTTTVNGILYKAIPGTYDLVAAAQVAHQITGFWETIGARQELARTIDNNSIGRAATESLLVNLRNEANVFFQKAYALSNEGQWQIGGDLPLYSDREILSGSNFFVHPNHIVGTLGNDDGGGVIKTNNIQGPDDYPGVDIVNAGLGNDFIFGSTGGDLIDGAEGIDILSYENMTGSGINAVEEAIAGTLYQNRFVINNSGFLGYKDYVYGVESFIGTNYEDTFKPIFLAARTLNGGLQKDVVDYSLMESSGISVVMNDVNGTVQGWNGSAVVGALKDTLTSIEAVEGTGAADRFQGGNGKVIFIGGAGGDTYVFTGGNDVRLYERGGDSGTDVILFSGATPDNTIGTKGAGGIWVAPDPEHPGFAYSFLIPTGIEKTPRAYI